MAFNSAFKVLNRTVLSHTSSITISTAQIYIFLNSMRKTFIRVEDCGCRNCVMFLVVTRNMYISKRFYVRVRNFTTLSGSPSCNAVRTHVYAELTPLFIPQVTIPQQTSIASRKNTYTNGPSTFSYNCLLNCRTVFPMYLFFTAIFIRP